MSESWPPEYIALNPGKRVLFLTKDLSLIKAQLYEGLELKMADLSVDDLLDDINTDVMTPAWVCFDHEPAAIAENAFSSPKLFPKLILGGENKFSRVSVHISKHWEGRANTFSRGFRYTSASTGKDVQRIAERAAYTCLL